jgi:integrase
MPKAKLTTKEAVQAIPHPKQGQPIWWCTDLTGFGVRVGARAKTFILERRIKGKIKPVRVTLGRVGQISLHKARQDAEQLIGEMVGGTDPVARKRDQTGGGITLRQAWVLHQHAMTKKNGSKTTLNDYQTKIDCHMSDWLDLPLIDITRPMVTALHIKIGDTNGNPYMANGVMRVLRAIWNRARKPHPHLPESPTRAVDFYQEEGRTTVITDWPAWWEGVQKIASPVRRDFYIWLALSGCRAGETMSMEVEHFDLKKALFLYPITKTESFELPLSKFMVALIQKRIQGNAAEFGADCQWIFPSPTSASGHLEEEKLTAAEPKLFAQHWSPHTLRHSWITNADQKVKLSDTHQRLLTNHALKRAKSGDAHAGYIHPDLDDLRKSQQRMTDFILAKIDPKPTKGKRLSGHNVVPFTTPNAA